MDIDTLIWRIIVAVCLVGLTVNVAMLVDHNRKALETNRLLFEAVKRDR